MTKATTSSVVQRTHSNGLRTLHGPGFTLIHGDVLAALRWLPPATVRCAASSPPYFQQRDYGVDGQHGVERDADGVADLAAYVRTQVAVGDALQRVLRDDGTYWLNLGDKYNHSGGAGGDYNRGGLRQGQRRYGACRVPGVPAKSLLCVPHRVAIALTESGWVLRCDNVWDKPYIQPTGVRDRSLLAHEYLFQLVRSRRYYFNMDALREKDGTEPTWEEYEALLASKGNTGADADRMGKGFRKRSASVRHPEGRAPRSVWRMTNNRKQRGHYAAFGEELPRRCVVASSEPGDLVLDHYGGTQTTGAVALRMGRRYIGIDINGSDVDKAVPRLLASAAEGGWL